jgi:hypothetical protein
VHEADQPDVVGDFPDADGLTVKDLTEIDLAPTEARGQRSPTNINFCWWRRPLSALRLDRGGRTVEHPSHVPALYCRRERSVNFVGYNGLIGLLVLAGDIWAIINIVQSSASNEKKLLWILVVLILPLLGLILWYFLGPRGGRA